MTPQHQVVVLLRLSSRSGNPSNRWQRAADGNVNLNSRNGKRQLFPAA